MQLHQTFSLPVVFFSDTNPKSLLQQSFSFFVCANIAKKDAASMLHCRSVTERRKNGYAILPS